MSLNYIKIKNFRSFEGEHEIKFNDDINVVLGNNETGKTNLANAISWCLYGQEVIGNNNIESFKIINLNAEDVFVECGFTINEKELIVSREFCDNNLQFIINYGEELFNVEDLISKEDFKNSYFTGEFPVDLRELSSDEEISLNQLIHVYHCKKDLFVKNGNLYCGDNKVGMDILSMADRQIISLFSKFVTVNNDIPLILDTALAMLDNESKSSVVKSISAFDGQIILLNTNRSHDEGLDSNIVYELNYGEIN